MCMFIAHSEVRSLVGRDFLTLKHFQSEDIKQLLWTAKDLKNRIKTNKEVRLDAVVFTL